MNQKSHYHGATALCTARILATPPSPYAPAAGRESETQPQLRNEPMSAAAQDEDEEDEDEKGTPLREEAASSRPPREGLSLAGSLRSTPTCDLERPYNNDGLSDGDLTDDCEVSDGGESNDEAIPNLSADGVLERGLLPTPYVSSSSPTHSPWDEMPEDASARVLRHLELREIAAFGAASRRLRVHARSDALWRHLYIERWNVGGEGECGHSLSDGYDGGGKGGWLRAYQLAHAHPHDLWITHSNCLYPSDGLTPGRCCILPPRQDASSSPVQRSPSPHSRTANCAQQQPAAATEAAAERHPPLCPACLEDRGRGSGDGTARATDGDALASDSRLRKRRRTRDVARQAFQQAATFHRTLDTEQYKCRDASASSRPAAFLTDLLFFNVTDPFLSDGQWELEQLLREETTLGGSHDGAQHGSHQDNDRSGGEDEGARAPNPPLPSAADQHDDGGNSHHETSHHTWHEIRLTNPDWSRPIGYQICIQRPDCFSVYPSKGYLPPGSSILVTIGVRPKGSALAYAFDVVNYQREAVWSPEMAPPDGWTKSPWDDLYRKESCLPLAPLLVRYRFLPCPPAAVTISTAPPSPPSSTAATLTHAQPADPAPARLPRDWDPTRVLAFFDRLPAAQHHWHTIHLSAHVHAHYTWDRFARRTCQAWEVPDDDGERQCRTSDKVGAVVVSAPALRERHPQIHLSLWRVATGHIGDAQRRGPCGACHRRWGPQQELLRRTRDVERESWAYQQLCRKVLWRNMFRCLRWIDDATADPVHLAALLSTLWSLGQALQRAPWLSTSSKRRLLQFDAQIDHRFHQIPHLPPPDPEVGALWTPWRLEGFYCHATCMNSVYGGVGRPRFAATCGSPDATTLPVVWKNEPKHLDMFRRLAYSPDTLRLGPCQDPNHIGETMTQCFKPPSTRGHISPVTDLFLDDPVSSMKVGLCMLYDVRPLAVHGLYDRVPYPGTLVRRPKLVPPSLLLRYWPVDASNLSQPFQILQLLNVLDVFTDCESSPASPETRRAVDPPDCWYASFQNYIYGVPAPGHGRFALSRVAEGAGRTQEEGGGPLPIEAVMLSSIPLDEWKLGSQAEQPEVSHPPAQPRIVPGAIAPGPTFGRLLMQILPNMDRSNPTVVVDRRILIATQWVCLSLMMTPLFLTLVARFACMIPTRPIEFELQGLPIDVSEMRYLNSHECGAAAFVLVALWLMIGRWSERHVGRDFIRIMQDHETPTYHGSIGRRLGRELLLFFQRLWDKTCPTFLQRWVFIPRWSRRSRTALVQHISFWKSHDLAGQRKASYVMTDARVVGDNRNLDLDIGCRSSALNVVVGIVVALGSFVSSSPQPLLNMFTVFPCSIGLGMSMSLHCLEISALEVNVGSTGSMLTTLSLVTVVILAFLVGQLVGSSGGILFLSEFIVMCICLLIGGGASISTSSIESWASFFLFSAIASFGYLIGRLAIMDGVRRKRNDSIARVLLSLSINVIVLFWILVFFLGRWGAPYDLVVVHNAGSGSYTREKAARLLS